MYTLLHCGKRRRPYRRVDIDAPTSKLWYQGSLIDATRFESLTIYEFRCHACSQNRTEQSILAWVGHPYPPQNKPTSLQKIQTKYYPQWLNWMKSHAKTENSAGVWRVQGSQRQWPYCFKPNIRLT